MKDTDSINMYKNMRETLVYLTHLDSNDTEMIMTEKLQSQVNGSEWSWKNLNTVRRILHILFYRLANGVIVYKISGTYADLIELN